MYAVTNQGRPLTFRVSGMLWNRSLVMEDLETRSLWSHILGQAMNGPLQGAELEVLPSVMTDWRTWKADHPQTTVLAMNRTAKGYLAEVHRRPGFFVLGIVLRGQAQAYAFDRLKKQPVINDTIAGMPVVVTFDTRNAATRMFSRKLETRTLTFKSSRDGQLTDGETQSIWNLANGQCVAGELQGKVLTALPAIVSYRRAWMKFHPDSRLYGKSSGHD